MKASFLICLLLVVVSCSALKAKKLTNSQQQRITEIKKTNSWAGILLNLAELHAQAKGPLDDLVAAIQDTVSDLLYKREKRDAAYVKRTNEHNALVTKLEADIARVGADIESTIDLLAMLAEQKAALEEENTRKLAENENIRTQMSEATQVRKLTHETFMTKIAETEEAVAVVEECLTILNEFAAGGASFAQVKKTKVVLAEAQKKIAKVNSVEASFLAALVQVASKSDFADNAAVLQVIGKFNEIKNNFYNSIGSLNADEAASQTEFEKFIGDSKATISENEGTVQYNLGLLEENRINTEENENLLAQLYADKADFEEQLAAEHASFEIATVTYENWCEENDREVAVCNEALEVVATVDFADYIGDRVNAQDGLVSSGMATSQQHGQGTEVFNFDTESPSY